MKPHKYSTTPIGDIIFHYSFSELREFLTFGKEYGTNGMILVKRNYFRNGTVHHIYKGFGVIENPCRNVNTFTLVYNHEFDGELKTPDEIINPRIIPTNNLESYRMIILDFN